MSDPAESLGHFRQFVASRRGVEAYVEPATRITSTTVVLIAHDGEWTRRAYPAKLAAELGPTLGIPALPPSGSRALPRASYRVTAMRL